MTEFFLIFLVFSIFSFCFLAALPIWVIVDCAISNKSNRVKSYWIVGVLILWSIGAVVYAFVATSSRKLKISTMVFCVPLAVFIGISIYSYLSDPAAIQADFQSLAKPSRELLGF